MNRAQENMSENIQMNPRKNIFQQCTSRQLKVSVIITVMKRC